METIMVVDDEALNRMIVEKTLSKQGYHVIAEKNGSDALKSIEKQKPDLLLLDIMMPGISGFEVCAQLKNREETKNIPVIMLTALSGKKDIAKGVEAGADEFITKPCNNDELLIRIRSLIQIKNLDEYFNKNQLLFEKVHSLTDSLIEEFPIEGKDIENIILTVLEMNLKRYGGEINKPEAIYYSFISDGIVIPETVIAPKEGGIVRRQCSFPFTSSTLEPLCRTQKGMLVSNWQQAEHSLEEYQEKLPRELTTTVGEVRNFIYYEDDEQKIMFLNFEKEISTFALTWFSHLIHYSRTISAILDRMRRKEMEYTALANSLSRIAEIKDDATGKHIRVKELCGLLCKQFGCSEGFVNQITDAVGLYDMGKLLIDHNILVKQQPLTDREWEIIKKIPEYVHSILSDLPRFSLVKEIAGGLYEHWDGSGYPNGRKGEEIPLSARVVSLANVYDALRGAKSYRSGFSHRDAMNIINNGDERVKPSHFDPHLLRLFNRHSDEVASLYRERFGME